MGNENILVIAPHMDDEILGVGGTMIKHIQKGNCVCVCIVTTGKKPLFPEDGIGKKEAISCHRSIGVTKTFFLDFPASMLENVNRYELNNSILNVIFETKPTIIFIPHQGDMQKDHQLVAEAAMVCLRPKYNHKIKKIYVYETLSETAWNIPNVQNDFIPNSYIDITEQLELKIEAMSEYKSQLDEFPAARSLEAIRYLAKYRGSIVNLIAAEAFSLIREIS